MGYYTEFKFRSKLKKDTPREVTDLLHKVIVERDIGIGDKMLFHSEDVPRPEIDAEFFDCPRWHSLFLSNNFDPDITGSKFYKENDQWVLSIHSEFKNYDDEIDFFINWIQNYADVDPEHPCVGTIQGEEAEKPYNIFL